MDDQRTDREGGNISRVWWCVASTIGVFAISLYNDDNWLKTSLYFIPAIIVVLLIWRDQKQGSKK
jgi:hypothetical protein